MAVSAPTSVAAVRSHEIRIDPAKPLRAEPSTGHNRWHPDIPPVLRVDPGDLVALETRDALDGQLTRASKSAEVGAVNLNVVHPLTGPVSVKGAQPGDLLEVKIRKVEAAPWAFTCQVPGFGFLRDVFPDPFLVTWRIADGVAESPDLPGVRIHGAPFPGTIGVAPSRTLLQAITQREKSLPGAAALSSRPIRPMPCRGERSRQRRCARSHPGRTPETWTSSSCVPARRY